MTLEGLILVGSKLAAPMPFLLSPKFLVVSRKVVGRT